jgi:uncharacterized membrane protein HdeD (DUF308 family)
LFALWGLIAIVELVQLRRPAGATWYAPLMGLAGVAAGILTVELVHSPASSAAVIAFWVLLCGVDLVVRRRRRNEARATAAATSQ